MARRRRAAERNTTDEEDEAGAEEEQDDFEEALAADAGEDVKKRRQVWKGSTKDMTKLLDPETCFLQIVTPNLKF